MDPITGALLIGGGVAQALGGIFGASGRNKAASKLVKREKKRVGEIKEMGVNYLSAATDTMKGAYSDLAGLKELDIDTSMQDAAYADARRTSEYSFGRSAGEEFAKDTARQSTADSLARARQSGASVADLLGFAGQAESRERGAMRDIDNQSMMMREERINQAMGRLEQAGARRADFYTRKEMAEFESDQNRTMMMSDFKRTAGMTIADITMQNRSAVIDAKDRVAAAKAEKQSMKAGNTEAIFQGLGSAAMDFGMAQYQNNQMMNYLG
jgi:hypothetical protein